MLRSIQIKHQATSLSSRIQRSAFLFLAREHSETSRPFPLTARLGFPLPSGCPSHVKKGFVRRAAIPRINGKRMACVPPSDENYSPQASPSSYFLCLIPQGDFSLPRAPPDSGEATSFDAPPPCSFGGLVPPVQS